MEKNPKISRLFWIVIVALLCMPLLQGLTRFITVKKLHGAIDAPPKPTWGFGQWFSGNFQDEATPYLNEQIGFYPHFIRVNNEVQYRLAHVISAKGVIEGKDHYLYESNYIKAYTGIDFIGEKKIHDKVALFQQFSDSVNQFGKQVLVILAPGKGSYFPEFIPEHLAAIKKLNGNYIGFKAALEKSTVPYIDAHQWFRNMKDTTRYPLFPKCGIHWSKYGEYLMMDSLSKYLNAINVGSAPEVMLDQVVWSNENLDTDYDLGNGMNIITPFPVFPMAYPQFSFSEAPNAKKKAMVVADSYYWGLHNAGVTKHFFKEGEFWYYNKEIHYSNGENKLSIDKNMHVSEKLKEVDLFVFLSTDANLYKFPFNFFEHLHQEKEAQLQRLIEKHIKRIKGTPAWLKTMEEKAKLKGISLEEAIYLDARYLATQ